MIAGIHIAGVWSVPPGSVLLSRPSVYSVVAVTATAACENPHRLLGRLCLRMGLAEIRFGSISETGFPFRPSLVHRWHSFLNQAGLHPCADWPFVQEFQQEALRTAEHELPGAVDGTRCIGKPNSTRWPA